MRNFFVIGHISHAWTIIKRSSEISLRINTVMTFNVSTLNNVLHALGDNITIQHTILKIRPQLKS